MRFRLMAAGGALAMGMAAVMSPAAEAAPLAAPAALVAPAATRQPSVATGQAGDRSTDRMGAELTLIRGGCGFGEHRGWYGRCRYNHGWRGRIRARHNWWRRHYY